MMASPPSFAPLARELRDAVIEHYEQLGAPLDTPLGRRTLDTNSTLAADRARVLLRVLAEAGAGPVGGRRVLDLGAGFGALAVYFAHLGADVVAIDPHGERLEVGLAVSRRNGLAVTGITAHADALPLQDSSFHVAVANNALCYVVDRAARRAALAEVRRVLVPGGWLAVRNPNRITPLDPFTGLPLVAALPPSAAQRAARIVGRDRSDVRLASPYGATRELRRAGFTEVRWMPAPGRRGGSRVARYHHVVARAPGITRERPGQDHHEGGPSTGERVADPSAGVAGDR
jgi:ubiquinone/menaquinone biosynthesis C-methylase UbiE